MLRNIRCVSAREHAQLHVRIALVTPDSVIRTRAVSTRMLDMLTDVHAPRKG